MSTDLEPTNGPRVGIVVGSRSDIGAAERAMAVLDELEVESEIRVISARPARYRSSRSRLVASSAASSSRSTLPK